MSLKSKFRTKNLDNLYFLGFLLITGVVSYLINYPTLGFYWDDWQAVFLYQNGSTEFLRDFFTFDRPFSSWTYELLFPILSMKPMNWQVTTLIFRVFSIWFLCLSYLKIYEKKNTLIYWFGFLMLVFPGFTLQPVSVAFNQHFFTFLLFSLSIYAFVLFLTTKSKWRLVYYFLALVLTLFHIFTMEYFIGLEIVRLIIFIHYSIQRNNFNGKTRLLSSLLIYLPYIFIYFLFIFWRFRLYPDYLVNLNIQKAPNQVVLLNNLVKNPLGSLITFVNSVLQDTIFLLLTNWIRPIDPLSIRIDAAFTVVALLISLFVSTAVYKWIQNQSRQLDEKLDSSKKLLGIGFIILIAGGIPVWLTNRQILVGRWSDRFSLSPMLGAVFLTIVMIYWFSNKKTRNIFLLFTLCFAMAFQMRNTHKFALDWRIQTEFYQQLLWRVPNVKAGTAFFSTKLPSSYSSDFSVGFALNTLYSKPNTRDSINHWYFTPADTGTNFNSLTLDQRIHYQFRNFEFMGNTSQALAYLFQPATGCLLILDDSYRGNIDMGTNENSLILLSNPDQILNEKIIYNQDIFDIGSENEWCYFFEKADLEKELKNWDNVLHIINEAKQLGFYPKTEIENIPELEALFFTQQWEGFLSLLTEATAQNKQLENFFLNQINRMQKASSITVPDYVKEDICRILDCSIKNE